MDGECFACASEASEQYTLFLASGSILKDKWVCEPCISDFRELEWIEVHEAPVMMRGEDRDDEEADDSEDLGDEDHT